MRPVLVVTGLTLREAARRKLVTVFALLTLAMIGLSAWGFWRLSHNAAVTSGENRVAVPQALILFMFMFSFVVALSASAIASPSVSAEVESGVLQTVATRPIRRSELMLGKWLGLAILVACYSTLVAVLEMLVVDAVSGYLPPDPAAVAAYLFCEGAVLLTLVFAISTRLSTLATGVIGVALFGAAWLAGVVGSLGTAFHISALRTVGTVSRYVLPTDALWHGAIYYLQAPDTLVRQLGPADPFSSLVPPSWEYLLFAGVWWVAVLGVAIVSFERREL